MSDTDQAWKAERLAYAIRQLEELKSFAHPADFDESMAVTWQRGSATRGYEELSKAMASIVSARWSELRDAALKAAQVAVDDAREELRLALNGTATTKEGGL